MLKAIKNLFAEPEYVEWKEYKKQIDFLDVLHWQQSVRKRNLHL